MVICNVALAECIFYLFIRPQFLMRQDQSCQVLCRQKLDAESAKNFKEKIDDEYKVNM